jgi:hypothetical protein
MSFKGQVQARAVVLSHQLRGNGKSRKQQEALRAGFSSEKNDSMGSKTLAQMVMYWSVLGISESPSHQFIY